MMDNTNVVLASLTDDQLIAIKNFETEFNTNYGNKFFIVACGEK